MEQKLRTIDVERRGYGQRYTGLPVDALTDEGFSIDCAESFLRPEMFDLLQGDVVRWRHEDHYMQGRISRVERNGVGLYVRLEDVRQLPSDYTPYY